MIMYEQDPDVIRWGLDILNCYPTQIPGYCECTVENDTSYYSDDYGRESNVVDHSVVENDEIIAHALQEEFQQLAVAEASGPSHADGDNSQASVLAQDWLGPSVTNYNYGNKGLQEEVDDMEPSTLSSSPGENQCEGEDLSPELTDDFSALDGEVGKRLNQMVPIPHIPKINGDIPSVDEATSDHERLLKRLHLYDLVELKVQGDGNCQFRALSDQFYRTTEHHKFVRQQVVNQLKYHPEIYEGYVPMAYHDYLKKLCRNGEWGDHVTLQAAADSYGVKIFVITSFKDTCYIEIMPNIQKSNRVIFLSFWAEVHYNSIYPEGGLPPGVCLNPFLSRAEMPILEVKKKKRWWPFGTNVRD